jgi:hypothetical protein
MKKLLFLTITLGLASIFTACNKSNDPSDSHSPVAATQNGEASLSDVLKAGSWMVDHYHDEEDKSADFTGYVFTFNGDGGLTLKKGTESYTGQWQVVREDGVSKVLINVNTINLVQKLNDKWAVKTINNTKLDMRNDNPARSEFMNIKRV